MWIGSNCQSKCCFHKLVDSSSSTIGSEVLKTGKLESAITSIPHLPPVSTVIAEYEDHMAAVISYFRRHY